MSAPAAALRPPCGRPGSPPRPRHRCICGGAEGLALSEVSRSGEMTGAVVPEGGKRGKSSGRGVAGRRQKENSSERGVAVAGVAASAGAAESRRAGGRCRPGGGHAFAGSLPQRGMTGGVGDGKRGVAFHLCKSESVQEYFFGGRLPQEKRWCSRNAYSPEKNALGEGGGAWGEGNTPCAPAKGVSFPPETTPAPVRFRRRRGVVGRGCGADFFRYRRGGGGGCRG